MSHYRKYIIFLHWSSPLIVIVACLAWRPALSSAPAQKSESPALVASLSVPTRPTEFIRNSVREPPARPVPRAIEPADWSIPGPHRKPTDADAWARFEAEYRPEKRNPSPVKRQLEVAKYSLDVTVFAVDRFVKNVREHADFEFDQGKFRRTRATSREGFLDNPRVKLDLDLTHGKPYLGARVLIPFGN